MLQAIAISKALGGAPVLDEVSITLQIGRITALLGRSGSGKTTLLRCLSMISPPDEGAISLDGEHFEYPQSANLSRSAAPWPKVTVVFQDLFLWPHMTSFDNIYRPAMKRFGASAAVNVESLARRLSFQALLSRYPNELSRGQRQLIAFARAVALRPSYLLLDEISASLDLERASMIGDFLIELARAGTSIMVITHQIDFAKNVAHDFVFLDDGRILERGDVKQLDSPESPELSSFLSLISKRL